MSYSPFSSNLIDSSPYAVSTCFPMFIPYQSFLHLIPAHQREIWIPSLEKQQIIEYNTTIYNLGKATSLSLSSNIPGYICFIYFHGRRIVLQLYNVNTVYSVNVV